MPVGIDREPTLVTEPAEAQSPSERLLPSSRPMLSTSTAPNAMEGSVIPGIVAFLLAVPLALLIHRFHQTFSGRPDQAIIGIAFCFALVLAAPAVVFAISRRHELAPERLALLVVVTAAILVTSIGLYWIGAQLSFPADILIWSETEFVSDILKLHAGYPLYTAQVNNESFIYTPGSQVITYLLSSLIRLELSIPAFRAIQLGFIIVSAIVGVMCCRRLYLLSAPSRPLVAARMWSALWLPVFFLVATNAITNPFVHNLHNDALTQLISISAFWLLLKYVSGSSRNVLAVMAVVPAAGFLVKQSLVIWAVLYGAHLVLFDRPRSVRRILGFVVGASSALAIAILACYLKWGDPFFYWTYTVLKAHPFSLLRSFQHVLDAWPFFAAGIWGGLVLLRGERFRVLLGPWLVWLAFLGFEAYTSGVAWMLNHLGPGSLIAGVWAVVAAMRIWPQEIALKDEDGGGQRWLQAGAAAAVSLLVLAGLGTVRIPSPPIERDVLRYVAEIEQQFDGPSNSILLDAGTWVYQRERTIMKDRVTSFGDRGYGAVGDFSGMLNRIAEKRYAKILVRNLHSPDFWYDHYLWQRSSGIRQALLANYHETGTINRVGSADPMVRPRYLFSDVSILVPNE